MRVRAQPRSSAYSGSFGPSDAEPTSAGVSEVNGMCAACAPGWDQQDADHGRKETGALKPAWGVTADGDAERARARYESWRDIERTVSAEQRKAEAYERLERELRSY